MIAFLIITGLVTLVVAVSAPEHKHYKNPTIKHVKTCKVQTYRKYCGWKELK